MPNTYTLRIDPDTFDLTFDDAGEFNLVHGDDTIAQCVRLTLQAYLGDFPLVPAHGTDWPRVLGQRVSHLNDGEVEEVARAAIFQETQIAYIPEISVAVADKRGIDIDFTASLRGGRVMALEVNTRG